MHDARLQEKTNKKEKNMCSINTPVLLSQKEAAEYLGTTVGTLNTWRHYGKDTIPYLRWGNRIKYQKEDLDAWIKANKKNTITTGDRNE
ncbi:MAG: helix-turn-helix domain-containing protein [Alphaproteobacteria bacterium]|nr:helix-turn-helix domain-containing protein [Alphaproteobacteria bacterium]